MQKTAGDIFTLHLCNTNSHMMYGSRDKRDRQNFLTFWTNFCPFTPLTTLKIKILKKWKKTPGDIILHMCTIKCDRQNFFSFWSIFYPFTNLTTQKIKILNKWKQTNKQTKNPGDIVIFTQVYHNWHSIIIYGMVPEIWSVTDRIFCHFGLHFVLLAPNNPENKNFEKMKKSAGDIIILHKCTINDNHIM